MTSDVAQFDIGRLQETSHSPSQQSAGAEEFRDFATRLGSVSEQARKLLWHIAQLAYKPAAEARQPDTAYLPELHESCGLDVDAMYELLKELEGAKLIELEAQYPFEDVRLPLTPSGWNPVAALASFAHDHTLPLRDLLVDLRFELLK